MNRKHSFPNAMLTALCLAAIITTVVFAASGDLDTTFSYDGKITQLFSGSEHRGLDVAVQPDGKVVAVGEQWDTSGRDIVIARYHSNGSLDATFSGDGKQIINIGVMDQGMGVVVQADGRIVIAGQACNSDFTLCDVAVVRLNTNGTFDTTFSGDGKLITDYGAGGDNGGFDLALQNGKIVVVGYSHNGTNYMGTIYRYLSNGTLDTTFSGDGIRTVPFTGESVLRAVAIASGRIYVTGYRSPSSYTSSDIIVARVNNNGTMDTTFGGDGKVMTSVEPFDYAMDLAISNGKAIVVGYSSISSNKIIIVRYTASGALDTTFSGDGKLAAGLGLTSPALMSVTLQSGKIVAAGCTNKALTIDNDALIVRYTATGTLDTTFSGDGKVITDWTDNSDVYESIVFKNSRLYVVGTSSNLAGIRRFVVAAYQP